jgi:hypothetical protein
MKVSLPLFKKTLSSSPEQGVIGNGLMSVQNVMMDRDEEERSHFSHKLSRPRLGPLTHNVCSILRDDWL